MPTKWIFNISQGTLTSPMGETWPACSGGLGDPLPSGSDKNYQIETLVSYARSDKGMRDFRDRAKNGWWCPITPLFPTSRSGFGIHPDGGLPGTHGCIGITSFDTTSAKRALQNAAGQIVYVAP